MYGAGLPPELSCLHEISEISMLRCLLDNAREGEDEGVQGQNNCYVQTSLVKSFCPSTLYKPLLQPGNNRGSSTKCESLSCQYSPVQAALMHSGHGSHALADNYSYGVWDHMSWTEITM